MELMEAIERRHSVRQYTEQPIEGETLERLQQAIALCNEAGGLHLQLILEEPEAFSGLKAKYGKFTGVRNYIALIGPKGRALEEKLGYYGEKLVLLAQQLGLNTCWVGGTYSKVPEAYDVRPGEKICGVIAIGYGQTQGYPRKSKVMFDVCGVSEMTRDVPVWYKRGVLAALMAPTAINQQKFSFERDGERVTVKAGRGPFAKMDLGIVRCHFEIGAGRNNFVWTEDPTK
ncbi:MAG: nitroreductase [Mogibacterium sp.]|nr:nitroreductase [Mogibacterium sp.]